MEKEEAGGDGVGVNLVELFHAFAKLHCFLIIIIFSRCRKLEEELIIRRPYSVSTFSYFLHNKAYIYLKNCIINHPNYFYRLSIV